MRSNDSYRRGRRASGSTSGRARIEFAARCAIALAAIVGGGTATFVTASAHSLNSTMPLCSSATSGDVGGAAAPCTNGPNVIGATSLLDSASVSAASDRSVKFMLWAPGECGVTGKSAVFTETVAVGGSAAPHNATIVTQGFFVATAVGVYEWTAELLHGSTVESGPTACGDEPANVVKATPTITTNASGGAVGAPLTDTAHVASSATPLGAVSFRLYGPNDPSCANPAVDSVDSVAVSGGAATTPPFTPTQAGTYHWIATYEGDAKNNVVKTACADEPVTVTAAVTTPSGGVQGIASGVQGASTGTAGTPGTPGTGSGLMGSILVGALFVLGGAALIALGVVARRSQRAA